MIELTLKILLFMAALFVWGYFWTRAADADEAKFQERLAARWDEVNQK